jgi:glutamate dehydrogenase (NAD(P)+)
MLHAGDGLRGMFLSTPVLIMHPLNRKSLEVTDHIPEDPYSPQLSCTVQTKDRVLGYLVIDSFSQGRSHGGIRMHEGVSEAELRLLARTMTKKYRFLNLPFGGAKAGVVGDPDAGEAERIARLTAFGEGIRPILEKELFVPAGDMGTDLAHIRKMLENLNIQFERRRLPPVSSGRYTAYSVFIGLCELTRWRGVSIEGCSAAVEGFGEVGSHLALLLSQAGACVQAVSTSKGAVYDPLGLDVEMLLELHRQYGSGLVEHYPRGERLPAEFLCTLPVDLLSPCANLHTIQEGNVKSIQAKFICPGANNPWPEGIEKIFDEEDIPYFPDFAANTGGILGTLLAYFGFRHDEIVRHINTEFVFLHRLILQHAQTAGVSIQAATDDLLDRREEILKSASPALQGGLIRRGMSLHRRGWIPLALVRPLAWRYLHRTIRAGLPRDPREVETQRE